MHTTARIGLALLPWLGVCHAALAAAPSAPDLDAIVKAVMEDQYGKDYDARHGCWTYTHTTEQGDDLTYCMRPGKPELVQTAKGRQLFVRAASVYDIRDDQRYRYSHVAPGLMGAFQLQLDARGGWTFLALDNELEFGSAGYCGCNDARFVKLSNQGDYGWLFASGGVWQGIVAAGYTLLLPRKGGFVDISRIPQVKEDEQGVEYALEVAPDQAGLGLFPLRVTRKSGAGTETFTVNFEPKAGAYHLPAAR